MAYMSDTAPTSEHSILENFPRIALILDLKELVLSPDATIRALKGTLDCASGACINADISANVGEKGTVNGRIATVSGKRMLELNASDAGALLKAVDMSDKVSGGTLRFSGTYDNPNTASALSGRLDIERFNVRQSQILARLFSITSLSGMANLLTGSGIDFDKLRADVRHERGVFTLSNARASGSSVGYTTEGTVDTRSSTLNLKGVLVPAYVFNSIIGKIPLIGAIAGGEGEGLISFNYTVSGKYADPEVSVNPLSGLTPGFLRGIFDMGGDSTKEGDAKVKPAKKLHTKQ
jgi:AsmA-like C-terminal region